MITSDTNLEQQVYTYWWIRDKQVFLTISLKKLFDQFLIDMISKVKISFRYLVTYLLNYLLKKQ
jgi:hypothetical protein